MRILERILVLIFAIFIYACIQNRLLMPLRKAKLGRKIESDIIGVLSKADRPISTREVAVQIGRAWHSVQGHCLRLQLQGKINGYRISNLNVWEMKK